MKKDESRSVRRRAIAEFGLLGLAILGLISGTVHADEMQAFGTPPGKIEFVGKNLFSTADGIFRQWRIVESTVGVAAIADAFVVVEVVLASVDTGNERRDEHLRTADFFDVERYPVAVVRVHSARRSVGDATSAGGLDGDGESASEAGEDAPNLRFTAQFDLDLHGVKKTIAGEVVVIDSDPLVFEGELVLDRSDFGIGSKPNRWNPMSPRAQIPVHFRVEL